MTLGAKQELFSLFLAHLILWCNARGIKIRGKEWWRSPETCELYAEQGKGIKNSLHTQGLAVDLVFSIDGNVTFDPRDYRGAGMYWKSLHPDCCWGGDFKGKIARDAGHFSLTHGGVR